MARRTPTLKGRIILDFLRQFPDEPTLTLAKRIYKQHPEIYISVDHVKNNIAWYRGARGAESRKNNPYANEPFNTMKRIWEGHNKNVEPEKYTPFTIPKAQKNVLLLSDIHLPYQDNAALRAAIEYGKGEKVDTIILNGDILDFYNISKYVTTPGQPDMKEEIDIARQFLSELREEFPDARIYYKEGNHEVRWYHYLLRKAPEIFNLRIMELDDVIGMSGFGITPIKDQRRIILGDLNVLHGHEIRLGGGMYKAAALWRKTKCKSIAGHLHRTDHYVDMDITRKEVHTWVTGCLCHLDVEYAVYNHWNHGFAHIKVKNGIASVNNIKIKNGKII